MSLVAYHRADLALYDIFAPLMENEGAGVALRYSSIYDQIKEARREDDANLSRGVWQSEFKRADWVGVELVCATALATQSKDLQIFGWLMESWLVMDGLKGAIKGFQTLTQFCNVFWKTLYPQQSEDDDARLFVFDWIDKTLHDRLLFVEITPALDHIGLRPLTLVDWIEAISFEKIIKRSADAKSFAADAEAKGKITLNRFRRGLTVAPKKDIQALYDDTTELLLVIETFCQTISHYANQHTPTFRAVREHVIMLSRIAQTTLEQRKPDLTVVPEVAVDNEQIEDKSINVTEPSGATASDKALTQQDENTEVTAQRADAYRALHELGKYLMEIDPHSPAPYLLELIVSWEHKKLLQIVSDINEGKSEAHDLLKLLVGTMPTR